MGEEQGGISPATVPQGEGLSGTPTAAPDPTSPTETWGKGEFDKGDMVWGVWGHPYRAGCSPIPPQLMISLAHHGRRQLGVVRHCPKTPATDEVKIHPWRSWGGSQTPMSPLGWWQPGAPWEETLRFEQGC